MTIESDRPMLTARFEEALQYAARLHAKQKRKGSEVPYVSHLLSVTAIVLEDGGGEDEAIVKLGAYYNGGSADIFDSGLAGQSSETVQAR